jgi:hypothetical protein
MANDFKDLNQAINKLLRSIERDINKPLMNKIGAGLVKFVKVRTQEGIGVSNGKASKYKSLKERTVERRKRLRAKGKLDGRTSPEISNQIESGKFIDGIHHKADKDSIEILPSKDRKKMADGQEKQGRTTFDLTEKEAKYITDEIEKEIDKIIDKLF